MIASDAIRAGLLGSIPATTLAGALRLEHLYAVAMLAGTFSAIFNIAASVFVPSLVGRDRLIEANSRFDASESLAEVFGPPLAGTLVQIVTAPLTIALDAFLVPRLGPDARARPHAGAAPSDASTRKTRNGDWEEIAFCLAPAVLRALAATAATGNLLCQHDRRRVCAVRRP